MKELVDQLKSAISAAKPNDRSEKDRLFAILITETEKLSALVNAWT